MKKKSIVNIVLIATFSLLAIVVAGISIYLIIAGGKSEKELKIPDVSNMSVVDAEKILRDAKLEVKADVEEKNSSTIEGGMVIETKPQKGRIVKEGTSITLVVSIGANEISLDNYVGKNYYEVKGILESKGVYVLVEKKEVSDKKNTKENIILEQKPEAGTKLNEGDTVTLYIPDIFTEYPDFVNESWSLSDIETFCKEYNIKLEPNYVETDTAMEGTILKQNRAKGTKVMANTTLIIDVAKAKQKEPVDDLLPQE